MTPGPKTGLRRNRRVFPCAAVLALVTLLGVSPCSAEVVTDGSLGAAQALTGPDFSIPENLGQTRGDNLFHSFSQFHVLAGESATFTGPDTIQNIISRVTGGDPSQIDGILGSSIDGANLYLLNPSGILFGPDARLDLAGSFHASTAEFLGFDNGEQFFADPAAASVLSVAAPASFGFLGGNPAGITLDGASLVVPTGESLSLVGGDIAITRTGSDALAAPSGRIDLVSVASPGEAIRNPAGTAPDVDVSSFGPLGRIAVSGGTTVSVRGDPGGTVVIRGGEFTLSGSVVTATSEGAVDHPGVGIDLRVTGDTVVASQPGATAQVTASSLGSGRGGDLAIEAGSLRVQGVPGTTALVFTQALGNGQGGNVDIQADAVEVTNRAYIRTIAASNGRGGDLSIAADTLRVAGEQEFAVVSTGTTSTGDAGDLHVAAHSVVVERQPASWFTGIQSFTQGGGDAGDVTIDTDLLDIVQAEVSAPTFGPGAGGDIRIDAETVTVQGSPFGFYGIFATAFSGGDAGNLTLAADTLAMGDHALVQTATFWTGRGGDAAFQVGTLSLEDGSVIATHGVFGAGGDAGNLTVDAESISISGPESSADPFVIGGGFTGFSTQSGAAGGDAGALTITAETLTLADRASLNTGSAGPGQGGALHIGVDTLEVLGGSNIVSNAAGTGSGGTITVDAGTVRLAGVHPEVFTNQVGVESLAASAIASQAELAGGAAGSIRIEAGTLELLDGGRLTTATFSGGRGGDIAVTADQVVVSGENPDMLAFFEARDGSPLGARSGIVTNAESMFLGEDATGDAGDIDLAGGDVRIADHGLITSVTTGPGTGGSIRITGDSLSVSGDGRVVAVSTVLPQAGPSGDVAIAVADTVLIDNGIVSTAAEDAAAGTVAVAAGAIQLDNGAFLSSRSFGSGNAGGVEITADETFRSSDSTVTTEAFAADGGSIVIGAAQAVELTGGEVTAKVNGGEGAGGSIEITTAALTLADTVVSASTASTGPGGDVRIGAAQVDIGAGSSVTVRSTGAGTAGSIEVQGDRITLSGGGEVTAAATGAGDGGAIGLTAEESFVSDGGVVTSSAELSRGGDITIAAPAMELRNGAVVLAESAGAGDAGSIALSAGDTVAVHDGAVSTEAQEADGGSIVIGAAQTVELTGAEVTASVNGGEGAGGSIEITTGALTLADTVLSASTASTGPGGDVGIDVAQVDIGAGSSVTVRSTGAGAAGSIEVQGERIALSGGGEATAAASGTGDGGAIELTAEESFVSDGGVVTSSAELSRGGDISIAAPAIELINGAVVLAESAGAGDAGSVTLTAGSTFESGDSTVSTEAQQADGGDITIGAGETVALTGSEVTASVNGGEGAGGSIEITTGALTLADAVVSASTASTGPGGDLHIDATQVDLGSGSSLTVRSTGAGTAGSIEVRGDRITLSGGGEVTAAASGTGDGGAVGLTAEESFISDGGVVTSSAELSRGGDISIAAPAIELRGGAVVLAESAGAGDAGSVTLTAGSSVTIRDSAVSTEARQADGGNVDIQADYMVYLENSQVTASVGGGMETTGGNIAIDPEFVILKNSDIVANAFEGTGGNIHIVTDVFLADPESRVDASSQLGIDGSVDIQAVVSSISGVLTPLPADFRSAADLLRESCLARAERGNRSSLTLGGRDAVPPQPGQFLPSPLW